MRKDSRYITVLIMAKVLSGIYVYRYRFWDTFRCLFPFLNLMYPSVNKEIQEGLVNTYKESGFLPNGRVRGIVVAWSGNNSASVLVDAYLKGVSVEEVETFV